MRRTYDRDERPEWVIFGTRLRDHYVVYASHELEQVELEAIYDEAWSGHFQPSLLLRYFEFSGVVRSFIVVYGSSYADCLTKLARFGEPGEWRNPMAISTELDDSTLALERGDET